MILSELERLNQDGIARIQMRIDWEESERAPFLLFVETDDASATLLGNQVNAFLIACILPAWRDGETRVKIDGSVCPVLTHNLLAIFGILKARYPETFGKCPQIEPTNGFQVLDTPNGASLALLSGGIDSLATLRWNKLYLPANHAESVQCALSIEFDALQNISFTHFESTALGRRIALQEAVDDARVQHIFARTNMWELVNDGYFFDEKWHGAVLSSVASCFCKHFRKALIASTARTLDRFQLARAWGSHPLVDPNYSSAHFTISHRGLFMTRMSKTALVADWPAGLNSIRVCQNDPSGTENCGSCHKCIETMVVLEALGKLRQCKAFPRNDIDTELIRTIEAWQTLDGHHHWTRYLEGLLPLLTQRGRSDLVQAIREVLLGYRLRRVEQSEIIQQRLPYSIPGELANVPLEEG